MEVNYKYITIGLLTLFSIGSLQANPPQYVTFSNDTPLSLSTSIAGLPGSGIEPSISKTVSYQLVSIGCTYGGNPQNCSIDFIDRNTGNKVATVNINALTATLNSEPIFYGDYGMSYQVSGWEDSPINHISITKKGGYYNI